MTVVDIHCHTFNAADLPVQGFVKRVAGPRIALAGALAWSLDRITQGMSSGAEEIAVLDRLIAAGPGSFEADEEPALAQADAEADDLLDQLETQDPLLAERAADEAAEDPGAPVGEGGDEGAIDRLEDLKRHLKWVALFAKDRLALTRALMDLYPEVDLFTPMLVDFERLDDVPITTMTEQLQLQERISRLGILGHFEAQVLPFVGFDPRRLGAVPLVKKAVTDYGCVGVKLYPLMGFLPIGNTVVRPPGMSGEDALGVDAALEELYRWCQKEQVPITAHSNPTNYASESYIDYSSPERWAQVLQRWPDLRLNLGHCGWKGEGWADQIAVLMATYTRLYADIGNHELADLPDTIKRLHTLYAAEGTRTLSDRFMFGSDWFMVANHRNFESFLTTVRDAYAARFPERLDRFMGGAALSFLGFDDADNANTVRVRQRYEKYGATPPGWLAG